MILEQIPAKLMGEDLGAMSDNESDRMPASEKCRARKESFAWYDKLLARGGLAALLCIGTIGIYRESLVATAGYLLFALVGGLLLVYDFLCVYCPYPYEYSDCLFFPHHFLTGVVGRRTGRIHWSRKTLFLATVAGVVLIPQYWLWGSWGLLAGFWTLAATIGLAFSLHYCGRCRHGRCALHQAVGAGPE